MKTLTMMFIGLFLVGCSSVPGGSLLMKIAVIGAGISGMTVAYVLSQDHEVTVFEANSYLGGHANTVPVEVDGKIYPVDINFSLYNEKTFPGFTQLLKEFEASPEVTRERLYLETIETVMSNTTKVMIDVDGGNNLLYLPLDRLMSQGNQQTPTTIQQFVPPVEMPTQQKVERRLRDTLRDRGAR